MLALLLAGAGVLLATATFLVSSTRPSSVVSFLLGIYVVAWTEILALALGLSTIGHLGRTELAIGLLAALVPAVTVWVACGRPRPPSLGPACRTLGESLRDPALATLSVTVGIALVYAIALGVGTPQNEWDSMSYHLTRAAYWIQQGSASYIPGAFDARVNVNPPNAEIGQLSTILLGGDDRFVWVPQLTAIPAAMLAIFGIGRRAGIAERGAIFGALVFACLPVVLLQASTAMNDLVIASFFATATYFALGTGRRSATGAALGLALGFGTKLSAPLLLPVYLLVVLAARRRRTLDNALIVVAGIALGSVLVRPQSRAYRLPRGRAQRGHRAGSGSRARRRTHAPLQIDDERDRAPRGNASPECRPVRRLRSGLPARRRPRAVPAATAVPHILVAAAIVATTPLLMRLAGGTATWAWRSGLELVGRDDLAIDVASFELPTLSDSSTTWYGPVGALDRRRCDPRLPQRPSESHSHDVPGRGAVRLPRDCRRRPGPTTLGGAGSSSSRSRSQRRPGGSCTATARSSGL